MNEHIEAWYVKVGDVILTNDQPILVTQVNELYVSDQPHGTGQWGNEPYLMHWLAHNAITGGNGNTLIPKWQQVQRIAHFDLVALTKVTRESGGCHGAVTLAALVDHYMAKALSVKHDLAVHGETE